MVPAKNPSSTPRQCYKFRQPETIRRYIISAVWLPCLDGLCRARSMGLVWCLHSQRCLAFFLITKQDDVPSGSAFSGENLWLSFCAVHRLFCGCHHATKCTFDTAKAKNENHRRCYGLSCRWHGPSDTAGVNAAALPVQSPVKMRPSRPAC